MIDIPIINLQDQHTPSGQERIASQLASTFTSLGFAIIINHGVTSEAIDELFRISKKFHALPLDEKMRLKQNHSACGYVPVNSYSLKKTGIGDTTETTNLNASFGIGTEIKSDAYHQAGLTVKHNH